MTTAAGERNFFVNKTSQLPRKISELIQGDYIGFNTGNGEKLTYSQAAGLAWLCLSVA